MSRPFYIARFLIEIGDLAIFFALLQVHMQGTFTIHQPNILSINSDTDLTQPSAYCFTVAGE